MDELTALKTKGLTHVQSKFIAFKQSRINHLGGLSMEFNRIFNSSSIHGKFSSFLSRLPKRNSKRTLSIEAMKTARGIALLFVSILLAWISVETTQNQATDSYRRNHWPKASVWNQTLIDRGLTPQRNLGEFSELLKNHPAAFTKESIIWTTPDACVVYLAQSPYQSGPELWTCEKKAMALKWQSFGTGLMGFEKLTDFFEISPKKARLQPKKNLYKIDPREFHY
jgi:hypothetical protein